MAKSKAPMAPAVEPSTTLDETPKTEPPVAPAPGLPQAAVKGPALGVYDDVVVIDRVQFKEMIRNLTHGYTHDYYGLGLLTKFQHLFRLKSYDEAKTLFNTFM